jgi:hypothetical protein
MSNEHISYAMRNEEARQSLLFLNDPTQLMHWTMPLLECLMIGGALLALAHAWKQLRREGNPAYICTWFATVCYGLIVEILSYNFVDNFWHGEFTVMLYYNHLPLYIMLLYPAALYPTFLLVKSFDLPAGLSGRIREACCMGFIAQMFYIPFDNLGPMLHWWVWDSDAPSLQPFWYSVPSTSYLWMMTLSMSFYVVARWLLWEKTPRSALGWIGATAAVGLLTNLGSVALQMPVTLLGQSFGLYFVAGTLIVLMMLVNALVFWFCPRRAGQSLENRLLLFPTAWLASFVVLYSYYCAEILAAYSRGQSELGTPPGNFSLIAVALVMIALVFVAPAASRSRSDFKSN